MSLYTEDVGALSDGGGRDDMWESIIVKNDVVQEWSVTSELIATAVHVKLNMLKVTEAEGHVMKFANFWVPGESRSLCMKTLDCTVMGNSFKMKPHYKCQSKNCANIFFNLVCKLGSTIIACKFLFIGVFLILDAHNELSLSVTLSIPAHSLLRSLPSSTSRKICITFDVDSDPSHPLKSVFGSAKQTRQALSKAVSWKDGASVKQSVAIVPIHLRPKFAALKEADAMISPIEPANNASPRVCRQTCTVKT